MNINIAVNVMDIAKNFPNALRISSPPSGFVVPPINIPLFLVCARIAIPEKLTSIF